MKKITEWKEERDKMQEPDFSLIKKYYRRKFRTFAAI